LAQDLIAKKCGIIKEDETLDNRTLQQYMDMYKKPLTEQTMDAIIKLTKVTDEKKKKKKQKKEKKEKKT
jgi:ABC-type transport system involved in cytochrome bd biosynthesis fused ATPase/permease subunit